MVPFLGLWFMKYIMGSIARVGVPGVYLMVPLLELCFLEYILGSIARVGVHEVYLGFHC